MGEMSTAQELFDRYHLAAFRFLRKMTGSREVAEDLLQDVFLRVVKAESRFRSQGTDRAWVFRIARNVLLNYLRDQGRRANGASLDEAGIPGGPARLVERLSCSMYQRDAKEALIIKAKDEQVKWIFRSPKLFLRIYDEITNLT